MFGVDTMTISTCLSADVWHRVKSALLRNGGQNSAYQYTRGGIHRVSFPFHEESGYYALRLQLSPAQLIGRRQGSLTSLDDVRNEFPQALRCWLNQHAGTRFWSNPLHWAVDRIDFAYDVQQLSQEQIDAYIQLTRAGSASTSFQPIHQEAWVGSAVFGNKNERIQLYDKARQMNRRHPDAGSDVLASYQGVLRIEVQIKKDRLASIREQAGWQFRRLDDFLKPGLAEAVIRQRVGEMVGIGPFVTFTKAAQRLAAHKTNRIVTAAEHAKLTSFLGFVDSAASVGQARLLCGNKQGPVSSATFTKYAKRLAELGIALPLIPRDSKVTSLPALLPPPENDAATSLSAWLTQAKRRAEIEAIQFLREVLAYSESKQGGRMTEKLIEILTASKPLEPQPAGDVAETSESAPTIPSAQTRRPSTGRNSSAAGRTCLKLSKGPEIIPQLQQGYRILRGPPIGGSKQAEQRIESRKLKGRMICEKTRINIFGFCYAGDCLNVLRARINYAQHCTNLLYSKN